MQDPFVELVNIMKKKGAAYNPPSIEFGRVLSQEPLVVEVGKLQLTKNNLMAADYLMPDYKRKIQIPLCNAKGSAGEHSITKISVEDGEIICKDKLKKDDKLALIATKDRQIYIILAKVVSL